MRKPQINPEEIFDPQNPNLLELEKLVEMGVNIVRETKGLKPLLDHNILYKAAADHNRYQAQNNIIGHVVDPPLVPVCNWDFYKFIDAG